MMSPRKVHDNEDVAIEAGAEGEAVEINTGDWMSEAETEAEVSEEIAAIEEQEPSAEAETVAEDEEQMGENKVALKALGRNLYQMGLDLGLEPDEAALLTGETQLPAFIGEESAEEFKQGLVEAYQEMLDQRLHSLKQKLGVG